jgi:putative two-component system hydrogenase maturation factor HypX/HoxX
VKILLLTHAFNSLAQRLFVELRAAGHELSVELDIADSVTEEAVALWRPDVVLAPFLKRAIPESVWRQHLCLVVHPGPPGDRGPSALDHAVLEGVIDWGVTVLQAAADFDAGTVWAWQPCTLRAGATKASLYRHEVVRAASLAVHAALARVQPGSLVPADGEGLPLPSPRGWRPLVKAADRAVDATLHDAAELLRRVRSADGFPGAAGRLFGHDCKLFDAHEASAEVTARAATAAPGSVVARRGPALLPALKLAATLAFAAEAAALPEWRCRCTRRRRMGRTALHRTRRSAGARGLAGLRLPQRRDERTPVRRLVRRAARAAARHAGAGAGRRRRLLQQRHPPARIEAAAHRDGRQRGRRRGATSRPSTTWRWPSCTTHRPPHRGRMLRGNAGAGGCFLALAADEVWAHAACMLNPHYKNMGNLYGSEYWTYLLPRRVGRAARRHDAAAGCRCRRPRPRRMGLIDAGSTGRRRGFFEPRRCSEALALAASYDLRDARARQAASVRADEAARAAGRLPRRRTGAHAPQLLRLRPQLPRGAPPLRAPQAARVDAAPPVPAPRGRRSMSALLRLPTVLVVDDEVRSQDAMRRTLDEDFTVFTASGADEARQLLERHEVNVILCDQRMPGLTGVVPARRCASAGPTSCASSFPATPTAKTSSPASTRPASTSTS